jgi:hypothetical protein
MDKLPRVDQQGVQHSDKAKRDETDNWKVRGAEEREEDAEKIVGKKKSGRRSVKEDKVAGFYLIRAVKRLFTGSWWMALTFIDLCTSPLIEKRHRTTITSIRFYENVRDQ